jgi:hypothetical protein
MNDPLSVTSDGRLTDASKPRISGTSVLDLFARPAIGLVVRLLVIPRGVEPRSSAFGGPKICLRSYGIVLVTSRDSNANNPLRKQMLVPARQGYETGAPGRI